MTAALFLARSPRLVNSKFYTAEYAARQATIGVSVMAVLLFGAVRCYRWLKHRWRAAAATRTPVDGLSIPPITTRRTGRRVTGGRRGGGAARRVGTQELEEEDDEEVDEEALPDERL